MVETLTIGDRILTRDNGIQAITWAGFRPISAESMTAEKSLRPILIRAGSLGHELPERDMLVSPHHRMLLVSEIARAAFGEKEVLVAAKDMTAIDGVDAVNVPGTTYLHFMFDSHQVVLSDGTWSECFQPNDYSLKGVQQEQRAELINLYPNLATQDGLKNYGTARKALKKIESYLLFK